MTRGGRRVALALLLAAGALFGGRALVVYLADRWWVAAAAPEALPFYLRRTLLRATLELAAVLLAWLWWTVHALGVIAVGRGVAGGPGNPTVRRALQHPDARLWALVLAGALALLTGVGTSALVDPLLLALDGVQFGLVEPALGLDAGVLVSRLPVWLRLHAWLTFVVLATMGLVSAAHWIVGAIRIGRGRASISSAARRQLGLLLAMVAVVVTLQQVLAPLELAAGIPAPTHPDVVRLHRSVSFVLVGIGLAVIGLSALWAVRPIHGFVAGGWLALSTAVVASYYFLPDSRPWPATAEDRLTRSSFERQAYGVPPRVDPAPAGRAPSISLWDADVVARMASPGSGSVARMVPIPGSGGRPAHAAVREAAGAVFAVVDDTVAPGGIPLYLSGPSNEPGTEPAPLFRFPALGVRPGAPAVRFGAGPSGIPLGGWLRRLVLAWSLQSASTLGASRNQQIGWRLTPGARLGWLAPFAVWTEPRLVLLPEEPTWVLDGVLTTETFPMARRLVWRGRHINYGRVGLLGVVGARSGSARVFLHREPDSLSAAWARIATGLIRPASELPPGLAGGAGAGVTLLELQGALWLEAEADRLGRPARDLEPVLPPRLLGPSVLLPVVDSGPGLLHAVLELPVRNWPSRSLLLVHRADSVDLEAPAVLERRWRRLPLAELAQDSVRAAGGELAPGRVRYAPGDSGLVAYQPIYGFDRAGTPRVVLVAAAARNLAGVGRDVHEALARLGTSEAVAFRPGEGESALLFEARRRLREADSALRSGDLVTFGRAFAALRQLLEGRGETGRPP